MHNVKTVTISKNKIDRIEDLSFPSRSMVESLTLEGNHILEIPSLSALQDIEVEHVRHEIENYKLTSIQGVE